MPCPALAPVSLRRVSPLPPPNVTRPQRLPRVYRPIVVGLAILERARGTLGPWRVQLSAAGVLEPSAPSARPSLATRLLQLHDRGVTTRLATALLAPVDVPRLSGRLPGMLRDRLHPTADRLEFYGWSLLYRLDATSPFGLVDAHEEHADLPAWYESAAELSDRAEYLAARGIASRPLALLTQPRDFDLTLDGRPCNRYCAAAAWRRARLPGRLIGD